MTTIDATRAGSSVVSQRNFATGKAGECRASTSTGSRRSGPSQRSVTENGRADPLESRNLTRGGVPHSVQGGPDTRWIDQTS